MSDISHGSVATCLTYGLTVATIERGKVLHLAWHTE